MRDRAEHQPAEAASTPGSHHQEVRVGRGLEQRVGGMPVPHHDGPHFDTSVSYEG